MATENDSYEYVYNVGLLDDLHNYFPAFLYDSGRFQTPAQMFHYLQTQMNARFNLPARGARLAGFSQGPRTEVPVQPPPRARRFDQAAAAALFGLLDLSGGFLGENSYFYSAATAAIPGNPGNPGIPFMDPVAVRPSEEVISANTRVQPGSDSPNSLGCVICQDVIQPNDVCRLLNACNHVYHKTCIDQWFLSNVHCPTCRHDIREAAAPAAPAAAAQEDEPAAR